MCILPHGGRQTAPRDQEVLDQMDELVAEASRGDERGAAVAWMKRMVREGARSPRESGERELGQGADAGERGVHDSATVRGRATANLAVGRSVSSDASSPSGRRPGPRPFEPASRRGPAPTSASAYFAVNNPSATCVDGGEGS